MIMDKRETAIKFKFTEKPDIRVEDEVIVKTEIRVGDIVAIERVSSSKVVIRTLDDEQLFYFKGKKYRVDKDNEPNTIKLTLL